MKKLFLARFELRITYYMNDGAETEDHMRLVWADDADEAWAIIEAQPEFQTDEYSVYRYLTRFHIAEALGDPLGQMNP